MKPGTYMQLQYRWLFGTLSWLCNYLHSLTLEKLLWRHLQKEGLTSSPRKKNIYSRLKEILVYIIYMCRLQPRLAKSHLQGFWTDYLPILEVKHKHSLINMCIRYGNYFTYFHFRNYSYLHNRKVILEEINRKVQ